ncbi:hypothetical protein F3J23_06890 [Chryseobacterium sp. Tr-659]|uniref:hypothetical protein n=1 Tax=Chryseobacterium sp. Tr-659 TaxID=2608340 RepID=UPI00141D93C8|nr:hypothetical protein [Chryseobacterium sp. Tr-659]NIF05166.1 hypothetical protein [Chryseobacterium sp. Tr-659]
MKTYLIIKNFLKKEIVQAVIMCIILVFLAFSVQIKSVNFMESSSINVLKPLDSADAIQKQIINDLLPERSGKMLILKRQYQITEEIKKYYRHLGTTYYVNYYSFSICAILFTTLLTVAVFLVVNKGWQNSGLIFKTFLLSNIILASIYYFLPNVLSNKDNLANNMEKIKVFQNIQSDIISVSYTIKNLDEKKTDSAILSHFNRISVNVDFPTTIDNTKINNELSKLLENYTGKQK